MMHRMACWFGAAMALLIGMSMALAEPGMSQVDSVVPGRFVVATTAGTADLPLLVSADWSRPLPDVTRAVVIVHDAQRSAANALRDINVAYAATGEEPAAVLLLAPQFLNQRDALAYGLPASTLRWDAGAWQNGDAAIGPVASSSFDAIDALLARLAEPSLFPALRRVIIVGHSAGAQMVQRYAVVGHGPAALIARRVAIRYVIANAPSYLWFGDGRPEPVDRASCPGFDRWSYGTQDLPRYVAASDDLERGYIARDVIYLLGETNTDPNDTTLDRSCAAEAQGGSRYVRGMRYLFGLELRHPNLVRHRLYSIPGVGDDGGRIFSSACGRAALFDGPGCPGF